MIRVHSARRAPVAVEASTSLRSQQVFPRLLDQATIDAETRGPLSRARHAAGIVAHAALAPLRLIEAALVARRRGTLLTRLHPHCEVHWL